MSDNNIKDFDVLNAFDGVEDEAQLPSTEVVSVSKEQKDADDDYEYTRQKLKSMIDVGEEAIDEFKDVCAETQEPRAYEVLATLIKNTGDLTKSVMDNSKVKASTDRERLAMKQGTPDMSNGGTINQTNNQIIFNGSTKELLEAIKKEQNDPQPVIEVEEVIENEKED